MTDYAEWACYVLKSGRLQESMDMGWLASFTNSLCVLDSTFAFYFKET